MEQSVRFQHQFDKPLLRCVFVITLRRLSGSGTPLRAVLLLGFAGDFFSWDCSDLIDLRVSVKFKFALDFRAGLALHASDFTLDFLVVLAGWSLVDFWVAGWTPAPGSGERRRRILGGVWARLVCRDSRAALLNNCPQSQRCSTSNVPERHNTLS